MLDTTTCSWCSHQMVRRRAQVAFSPLYHFVRPLPAKGNCCPLTTLLAQTPWSWRRAASHSLPLSPAPLLTPVPGFSLAPGFWQQHWPCSGGSLDPRLRVDDSPE